MASLLSHELNQPLAAIASYATGLGPAKDLIEQQADLVARAHAAGLTVTAYTFRSRNTGRFRNVREEMAHFLNVLGIDAVFGVFCRRWGVPLVDGGTVRLPRIVGMGRALEIILTGRKVPAEEALRIGACEHVVPDGKCREFAEAMAHEIARFPQACTRADRRSVYAQQGLTLREAMRKEWYNGIPAFKAEGAAGAARFASGKGRHGDFGDI